MKERDEQQLHEALTSLRSTVAIFSSAIDRRDPGSGDDCSITNIEDVVTAIRERALRSSYIDGDLFADPAWDMLLDLFAAELVGDRISVTSLTIASCVPATTALRWIKRMVDCCLLQRRPDTRDGRRIFVELAPEARKAMHTYFDRIGVR